MAEYDNSNSGALWPTGENKLIRQGKVDIDGSEVELAVTHVTTKTGKTIFEVFQKVGVVFANDRKDSENHPDMKGSLTHDGSEYWVAGWKKESKNGLKFTSVSFSPKEQQDAPDRQQAEQPPEELDEEIPF